MPEEHVNQIEGLPPEYQTTAEPMPGFEWCAEHQQYERIDDRIDFRCSPTWLAHYHETGLTHRRPVMDTIVERAARQTYDDPEELMEVLKTLRDTMNAFYKASVAREGQPRRRLDSGPPPREVQAGIPPQRPQQERPVVNKAARGVEL